MVWGLMPDQRQSTSWSIVSGSMSISCRREKGILDSNGGLLFIIQLVVVANIFTGLRLYIGECLNVMLSWP